MDFSNFQPGVLQAVGSASAVGWQMILAMILSSAISSFKIAAPAKWDKLNALQVFIAPIGAIVVTLLLIHPITIQSLVLGFTTGVGAIAWHEMQTALQMYIAKTGIKLPFGDHFVYGSGDGNPDPSVPTAVAAAAPAPAPADTSSQQPPSQS